MQLGNAECESTTVNGQISVNFAEDQTQRSLKNRPTRQTHAHDHANPGAHPAADSEEAASREPAPPPSRTYHTV